MDEKHYDVQAVKDWLNEYLETEQYIDDQIERIEYLEARLEGVGAQNIDGMPKAHGASRDRWSNLINQKDELDKLIKEMIQEQDKKRAQIMSYVVVLRNKKHRSVIQMRFLDRADWKDVQWMLFGKNKDFEDRIETYERKTFRYYHEAAESIANYIETKQEKSCLVS